MRANMSMEFHTQHNIKRRHCDRHLSPIGELNPKDQHIKWENSSSLSTTPQPYVEVGANVELYHSISLEKPDIR